MPFNDDELFVETQNESGSNSELLKAGRAIAKVIYKPAAPLEETKFKVLLEIMGSSTCNDRPGVDIVTVLDTSSNMEEKKLAKLKIAMKFLIKKLSPKDRLSIVTYSKKAERKTPLLRMTKNSQAMAQKLVNDLQTRSGDDTANTCDGLQTASRVLDNRRVTSGRVSAIMLVSASVENSTQIPPCNVPVYTFGFGDNYNCTVLNDIAKNSGGTFSMVDFRDTLSNNLSIAFSQCLAGLLTVVVQDLKLTITKGESKIEKVSSGSYLPPMIDFIDPVTVSFGNLYSKETRKVMVDVILPPVRSRSVIEVLKLTYSYRTGIGEKPFQANPLVVVITRTDSPAPVQESKEVTEEEARLKTVDLRKEATELADSNKLDEGQDKLVEAQNMLEDVEIEPNQSIEMLKYELYELVKLMQSEAIYNKLGHAFALASDTSHDQQRFGTRTNPQKLQMFTTPLMKKYIEQANSYYFEDEHEETALDPSSAIHRALLYYFEDVIHSLKVIQVIVSAHR